MGKFTIANLKKTLYYFQRNGLRATWNAARERLSGTEQYHPETLSEAQKSELRKEAEGRILSMQKRGEAIPFFSILVPAYGTDPVFLRELVQSVKEQVYPRWELLLLDASEDKGVLTALRTICGELALPLWEETAENAGREGQRVRYVALPENAGISENTNAGLGLAKGDYIGLLDHDDVLTADALYEMALAILARGSVCPDVLYSDEDKWDGAERYYEYNRKEDFNLDLLLSNNYICHFLVMKTELFRELRLRREFDGAQDYDLVLRACAYMMRSGAEPEQGFCHVPKVLYHWRCHNASTAENPRSKGYAYEAGRRALQDFADRQGWDAVAEELPHVGFYRLQYFGKGSFSETDRGKTQATDPVTVLKCRPDLGAIGGKVMDSASEGKREKRVLVGGRMSEDGSVFYEGLEEGFSGYLHRGVLTQDAEAVDLRCICVAPAYWTLFEQTVGVPYVIKKAEKNAGAYEIFDAGTLPPDADMKSLSIAFCKALQAQGKRILWDPFLAF